MTTITNMSKNLSLWWWLWQQNFVLNFLTIDGQEEFGKNYVLVVPAGAEEDENGEVEIRLRDAHR